MRLGRSELLAAAPLSTCARRDAPGRCGGRDHLPFLPVKHAQIENMAHLEDSNWSFLERRHLSIAAIAGVAASTALDVGAGAGGNTRVLEAAGWRATALEFSDAGVQLAGERGINVVRGDGSRRSVPGRLFRPRCGLRRTRTHRRGRPARGRDGPGGPLGGAGPGRGAREPSVVEPLRRGDRARSSLHRARAHRTVPGPTLPDHRGPVLERVDAARGRPAPQAGRGQRSHRTAEGGLRRPIDDHQGRTAFAGRQARPGVTRGGRDGCLTVC